MEAYSVREAAEKMGISITHCRRLLEQGKLPGKRLGHDWVCFSLDYQRQRLPGGQRKRGKASGIVTSALSKSDAQELSKTPKRNERG